MRIQHIGPSHKDFDHREPYYTQVLVFDVSGKLVAQFTGCFAKREAHEFVMYNQ